MSDPAVEAAKRQLADQMGAKVRDRLAQMPGSYMMRVRTETACEALKPIRELHYPVSVRGEQLCGQCSNMATQIDWPCRTARLIYTAEELS